MPRPRRANQFVDSSASRARQGESDRAPVFTDRQAAIDYNKNQDKYAREINRYATSEATRYKPQYAVVPPARPNPAQPVVAVVSAPVLPGNAVRAKAVREGMSAAEKKRRADAKRVAAYRREHPAPLSYAEKISTERLEEQGVRALTWCLVDKKKTGNYDSKIVPIKRRVLKSGELSAPRFRLVSKCRLCHRAKSTALKNGTPIGPDTCTGGKVA